jgi:hypothetical protein
MTPVSSSFIEGLDYDESSQTLTVYFKSGGSYDYTVPKDVYTAFLAAPSKGRYFRTVIKGTYE